MTSLVWVTDGKEHGRVARPWSPASLIKAQRWHEAHRGWLLKVTRKGSRQGAHLRWGEASWDASTSAKSLLDQERPFVFEAPVVRD